MLAAERYKYANLLLEDLNSVPVAELGEEQYLLVIDAFQKVHRTSPASSYCDDALFEAAQLYREMIGRFGAEALPGKSRSTPTIPDSRIPLQQAAGHGPPGDRRNRKRDPARRSGFAAAQVGRAGDAGRRAWSSAAQPPDPAAGAAAPAEQTNKVASGSSGGGVR